MGKWCLHASSFIFDHIVIKVAGNQDRHKSLDEFDFGPLVSMAHLYVFWNEIWPLHIGLRWAIVALWATCLENMFILENIIFLHMWYRQEFHAYIRTAYQKSHITLWGVIQVIWVFALGRKNHITCPTFKSWKAVLNVPVFPYDCWNQYTQN